LGSRCRESSKTAVTPPQLTLQSPYYSSNTPIPSQGTSSYGRPIQIEDLLQQAEINQPTTSNNSRSSTPAYHDITQYENPKKDILGELFQKASSIDPLPVVNLLNLKNAINFESVDLRITDITKFLLFSPYYTETTCYV
jgi:hypothetical protein